MLNLVEPAGTVDEKRAPLPASIFTGLPSRFPKRGLFTDFVSSQMKKAPGHDICQHWCSVEATAAAAFFSTQARKETVMDARKIAAQYAAYVWFENVQGEKRTAAEKRRFAEENWQPFLRIAPEGWGRLLMEIARGRSRSRRKRALCAGSC